MKGLILGAALAAAPAIAQDTGAPAPAAAEAVDPARLALARIAVDAIWPVGTYERMMRGTAETMANQMMGSMMDMRLGDMVPAEERAKDPKAAAQTLREAMSKEDPHFLERMRIMNRILFEEMIPLMNRYEPGVREALARSYARKFSAEQLADMNRFFATPSGKVFGSESMLAFSDPEIMGQMAKLTPDLIKEMPRIMKRVEAATAHLPLPSKPKGKR